ncbi:hypothetical protein LLH23_18315 [bacterium]|nr:hypothetical protein [bacterium]
MPEPTPAPDEVSSHREALRPATVVLCLVLAIVAVLWAREAELVAFACQITEAVPPMTALGFLIFLVMISLAVRGLARRLGPNRLAPHLARLGLSGPQTMYLYAFIMVATIVFSVGGIRTLLPELTTMTYFADPTNDYAAANLAARPWLHVTDPEAVRQFYEGFDRQPVEVRSSIPGLGPLISGLANTAAVTQAVPWRFWIVPLTAWGAVIFVVFVTMQCLAGLLEREWTLSERLPYPLVEIPLGITEARSFGTVRFLRDPVMWIGFALGCAYGLHEMIAATTLAFPAWGRYYLVGKLLTERPWSAAAGGVNIFLMPEAYGLAYFASQEVLLSTAVSWLGYLCFSVLMTAFGAPLRGPVTSDVSLGSFVGFVGAALWLARRPLGETFGAALGLRPRADEHDDLRLWMARGALAGLLVLAVFMVAIGLPVAYGSFFLAVFMVSAIGHARVRAMAGAATPWLFPYTAMTDGFVRLFGSQAIGPRGVFEPFVGAFHLKWMDRGYVASALAADAESYNMARRGGLRPGSLSMLLVAAVPVGIILGFWMHLTAYYESGANVLEGGKSVGGVRTLYALTDARWATQMATVPTLPNKASWVASLVGLAITVVAVVLRGSFLRFPFHPAGFVIGLNHGERFWAPFLIVWAIKSILLRTGGVSTYRRLMPAFLGVVIGHFFFTGIIMGLAKMTGLSVFENLPIIWF